MLTIQHVAPSFCATNHQQEKICLSDYAHKKNVVLYFYPKDDTPGCTLEAQQFTALATQFANADTVVLGVSKDDCSSHQAFIKKYALSVILLADTSGELCEKFGVWQEKIKNGEKKMGIVRSTFIIDKTGILRGVEYSVNADGHAQQVLARVQTLK